MAKKYIDADALIKQMKDSKYIVTDSPFARGVNGAIDYWATEIKYMSVTEIAVIDAFAKRLKERCEFIPQHHFNCKEVEFWIDAVAKEMKGERR